MLQASLKVIGGKNDGKLIHFKTRKFLVGREQDCHLRPNSDLVSRHHCVFTLDDYTLRLRDLGSTNGTLVNGRRIRGETVLVSGDVVRIGKLNLEIVVGDEVEKKTADSPDLAQQETSPNTAALDTKLEAQPQTTLEDSGMISTSSSSETVQFKIPVMPTEDMGSDDQVPAESDTVVGIPSDDAPLTDTEIPVAGAGQPEAPPQQPPAPEGMPQQYPPQYPPQYQQYPPQYPPQYQQYPPPGYPMGYPPPQYPPGYGFPPQQPGQYPPNFQQPAPQQPPDNDPPSSSEIKVPDLRIPEPEDTGVKDEPKPEGGEEKKPKEATATQKAADDLIKRRNRRG